MVRQYDVSKSDRDCSVRYGLTYRSTHRPRVDALFDILHNAPADAEVEIKTEMIDQLTSVWVVRAEWTRWE